MTTHPLGHNPLLSGGSDLSPDHSGGLGADPGLWLAEGDTLLTGSDVSGLAHDSTAEWLYYLGQSKPVGLSPHTDNDSSAGGSAANNDAISTTVSLVDNYGSGFPHAGPPGLDFFTKPGGGGGGGGGHGGHGGGGGGGLTPYSTTINGIHFVANWDSSVANAPSGFQSGFETAIANVLGALSGPLGGAMTVTMNVGWGEVGGQSISRFALGESSTYIDQVGYSALQSKMGYLPSGDPISGSHYYWVSTAQEKALGLVGDNTSVDGSVGFGSSFSWDFSPTTPPGSGQYDFIGVAEHEITEVMGRIALLGGTVGGAANSYSSFDLFRFSGPDTRSLQAGSTAYFSFDGGKTSSGNGSSPSLTYFNTQAGGDYGDWASSAGNDAYDAYAGTGVAYTLSSVDQLVMDALGYGTLPTVTA